MKPRPPQADHCYDVEVMKDGERWMVWNIIAKNRTQAGAKVKKRNQGLRNRFNQYGRIGDFNMRRGYKNQIIRNEHGRLIGINLGSDFVAEHEWGIKGIKVSFGIDDSKIGVDKRRINTIPENGQLSQQKIVVDGKDLHFIIFVRGYDTKFNKDSLQRQGLIPYLKEEMATAWDENSFGIACYDERPIKQLFEAIQKKDVVIGRFGGGIFQNSGLGIYIISALPDEVPKSWEDSDNDGIKLKAASEATGIAKFLEEAGETDPAPRPWGRKKFSYYALSPAWKNKNFKSKYDVIYWLNPCAQDENNSGWYSVEDLQAWTKGKGPIPKNNKKKA